MLAAHGSTVDVVARFLDFVGDRSPWQRRLWTVGTLLRLAEVEEAVSLSSAASGLHEATVKQAMASARELAREDPGIGSPKERSRVAQLLSTTIQAGSEEHHRLREIIDSARPRYLARWAAAVAVAPLRIEFSARLIAAHLLDGGSSPGHLYRWLDRLQQEEASTYTLAEILELAKAHENERYIEVFVPFIAMPAFGEMPSGWHTAEEAAAWLAHKLPSVPAEIDGAPAANVVGGIVVSQRARDAG